jgi:hypothetical protein
MVGPLLYDVCNATLMRPYAMLSSIPHDIDSEALQKVQTSFFLIIISCFDMLFACKMSELQSFMSCHEVQLLALASC